MRPGPKRRPLLERFWERVQHSDGCWVWSGDRAGAGYGRIGVGGRNSSKLLAHRLSWEIHHGPIPDGLFVCHHCDNPTCVRPDHLFLGTTRDNARDMAAKGRQVFQRHPERAARGARNGAYTRPDRVRRGAANGRARLGPAQVRLIREMSPAKSCAELAREFGVAWSTVRRILSGEGWRDAA